MRRTLADARAALEQDVAPHVNNYQLGQYREVLTRAEAEAKTRADAYLAERADEVSAAQTDAVRTLTAVRDAFDDLTAGARSGRIPADAFAAEIATLRARQAEAEDALRRAEEKVEAIAQIEADPLRWSDDLSRRLPHLRENFPW